MDSSLKLCLFDFLELSPKTGSTEDTQNMWEFQTAGWSHDRHCPPSNSITWIYKTQKEGRSRRGEVRVDRSRGVPGSKTSPGHHNWRDNSKLASPSTLIVFQEGLFRSGLLHGPSDRRSQGHLPANTVVTSFQETQTLNIIWCQRGVTGELLAWLESLF